MYISAKPCPELEVPLNAALVCNDWKTDFGKICTYFCDKLYTVPRGMKPNQLYVCGATGLWTPNSIMPNCSGVLKISTQTQISLSKWVILKKKVFQNDWQEVPSGLL